MDGVQDVVEILKRDRVAHSVEAIQGDEKRIVHAEQEEERQIPHVSRYTAVLQQHTTPKYVHAI